MICKKRPKRYTKRDKDGDIIWTQYVCPICGQFVWRNSKAEMLDSWCSKAYKTVQLIRVKDKIQ